MNHHVPIATTNRGVVRPLTSKEGALLREHLLRLDAASRHDRFNGFIDSSFIDRYAAKCMTDGTIVIAYLEDGVVRGAAELHQPDLKRDSLPEIAFSVESSVRRKGVGSLLFTRLIEKARALGYRKLRITTGAQNDAMRALANKFGAHLTFRSGESTGSIDLGEAPEVAGVPALAASWEAARTIARFNRAWWRLALQMYGWRREA